MISEWTAKVRVDDGRGASRRQRNAGKIPGIIYGGGKDAVGVTFETNFVKKALSDIDTYNTVLQIDVEGGKKEKAIIKDIQRHPARDEIMHIDMQRVIDKTIVTKVVPLVFEGRHISPGVKMGGLMTFLQKTVEIRCTSKDLPTAITVDVSKMEAGSSMRLSDLELPKGVKILALTHGSSDYDQAVVSVGNSRKA